MSAAAEVIMCEQCGQRKSEMLVIFTSKENRGLQKEMCFPCYGALTASQGLTYHEWYKQTHGEEWTDNHVPMSDVTNGYEDYCRVNNLIPCWDV